MDRKCSKCSNCGNVGHNSRTCKQFMLVGIALRASSSSAVATTKTDCLDSSSSSPRVSAKENPDKPADGHLSDGPFPGDGVEEEKKWSCWHWTEEEHGSFLEGLEKLGKGHWTRLSREYVKTKTPAQVASHAQKYYLRQKALNKKRPSRLFDTVKVDGRETKQNQPPAK